MEKENLNENIDERYSDYTGYSEKQVDINTELHVGRLRNIKIVKTGRKSRLVTLTKEEALSLYNKVSEKLSYFLTIYVNPLEEDFDKEQDILLSVQQLSNAQEIILDFLINKNEEFFRRDMLPQEVWDIIK